MPRRVLVRLLPFALGLAVLGAWFADIQQSGPYVFRNLVPPAMVLLPLGFALWRGQGRFADADLRMLLATAGFAIPSIGLSVYLHYAYSVNLNDLFEGSRAPLEVFRFLPIYTSGAGLLGAAIGWIVGRNV